MRGKDLRADWWPGTQKLVLGLRYHSSFVCPNAKSLKRLVLKNKTRLCPRLYPEPGFGIVKAGKIAQKALGSVPVPHKRIDAPVGVVDVRAAAEATCVECRKGMGLYTGQDVFGTDGVLFHRILKHKKQPERYIRCVAADVWGLARKVD